MVLEKFTPKRQEVTGKLEKNAQEALLTCALHQILLGHSNQESDGWGGGDEACMQR
jgi:hypothetical protein